MEKEIKMKLYNELFDHIPTHGQTKFLQPELIRQIDKLEYEAMNNGNGNWDKDFEFFLDFIHSSLNAPETFSESEIKLLDKYITRLRNFDEPCLDKSLFDGLIELALKFYSVNNELVPIEKLDTNR